MRMIRLAIAAALALAGAGGARAQTADAPARVQHTPPADVGSGEPLVLYADVDNGFRLESLVAHYRTPGRDWRVASFGKRPEGGWGAVIEPGDVQPPHVEYYITARERGGAAVDWFASAASPHPVLVLPSDDELARRDRLARHRGHTSQVSFAGEFVDYGTHAVAGQRGYGDHYYQLETSYLYRILSTISYIQLGLVTLRGTVPPPESFSAVPGTLSGIPSRPSGMDYGYAAVGVSLTEVFGLEARLILGADDLGFASGAGAVLRFGEATSAHLDVGGQIIQRVGFDSYLRFFWDTVPRWPMALGLHVTNIPAGPLKPGGNLSMPESQRLDDGAPQGVRVIYDVGYEVTPAVTLLVRAGYQARIATGGGANLGAGLRVEW